MPSINDFYQIIWNNINHLDKEFYIDSSNVRKSYHELSVDIQKFFRFFNNQKNQLTVILAKKNYDNYCAILATVLSGNTWIPLSLENPWERNLEIIMNLKPKFFFTDMELSDEIKSRFEIFDIKTFLIKEYLEEEILKINNQFLFNYDKTEIPIIFFTSGSTGIPKGVKISHEGLSTAVSKIVPLLQISQEIWGDYHDLSFVISINILFKCVFSGGTIYCGNKIDQFMPCESLIRNKVTCLITVPSTLARIAKNNKFKNIFKSLKTIVSCGEPLPIELMRLYLQNDKTNLFNFYGSTELTSWIFYHHCKKQDFLKFNKYGYAPIGKVISGNKIKITDEKLLIVQSPQTTPGYLGENKNSHIYKYMEQDWFSMGDVVEKIGDIYICKGRFDNQIKLNGYRIHLMDIETQIKKNENIEDCLCVTEQINDNKIITAILVTKFDIEIEFLREFLKKKLPNYMLPRKVFCIKDKPVNKNGKLDRTKLKSFLYNS